MIVPCDHGEPESPPPGDLILGHMSPKAQGFWPLCTSAPPSLGLGSFICEMGIITSLFSFLGGSPALTVAEVTCHLS